MGTKDKKSIDELIQLVMEQEEALSKILDGNIDKIEDFTIRSVCSSLKYYCDLKNKQNMMRTTRIAQQFFDSIVTLEEINKPAFELLHSHLKAEIKSLEEEPKPPRFVI
jgi:hypothetical protein